MPRVKYRGSSSTSGTGTSIVVTKPAALAVGDAMLAHVTAQEGSTGYSVVTPPAGWTTILNTQVLSGSNYLNSYFFGKVAVLADVQVANFTFTANQTPTFIAGIVAFYDTDSTNPFDQSIGSTSTGGSTYTATGITPTVSSGMYVIGVSRAGSLNATFSGYAVANNNPSWIELWDINLAGNASDALTGALAYGAQETPMASGTVTAVASNAATVRTLQVVNVVPAPLTAASMVATAVTAVFAILASAVSMTAAVLTATFAPVTSGFTTLAKSATSWLNTPKS
jgi:hypothetical protein